MPIQIEGLAELSELLTQESGKAARRYLTKCGKAAGNVVLDALKDTVPEGITGRLEDRLTQAVSFESDGETTMTVRIGPAKSTWWGSWQEFGTRFQQGQYWMTKAWSSCRDRVLDVFATEATGLLLDLQNKKK